MSSVAVRTKVNRRSSANNRRSSAKRGSGGSVCFSYKLTFDSASYGLYSLFMKPSIQIASKGAEEARQNLPAILAAAAAGQTTFITRHGRQIAAVVPVASLKPVSPVSLLTIAGTGAGLWGKQSSKVIDELRNEWS